MNAPSDKQIDQLASSYGRGFEPDVERALRKVRGRIAAGAAPAPTRVRRLPGRSRWAVAAAALLLLAAGYFLFPAGPTVLTAGDAGRLVTALPDGTRVILQEGAELTYAEDYNQEDRRIELLGQAYFEVEEDAGRPFLVGHGATELRVTGTAFNLRVEGEELEVEVSEGSVVLVHDRGTLAVGAKECGLAAGDRPAVLMPAPHLNRHAWRTGSLLFEQTPVREVLTTLEHNYGVRISWSESCDFPVSAHFQDAAPVAVLADLVKMAGGRGHVMEPTPDHFELANFCGQ